MPVVLSFELIDQLILNSACLIFTIACWRRCGVQTVDLWHKYIASTYARLASDLLFELEVFSPTAATATSNVVEVVEASSMCVSAGEIYPEEGLCPLSFAAAAFVCGEKRALVARQAPVRYHRGQAEATVSSRCSVCLAGVHPTTRLPSVGRFVPVRTPSSSWSNSERDLPFASSLPFLPPF